MKVLIKLSCRKNFQSESGISKFCNLLQQTGACDIRVYTFPRKKKFYEKTNKCSVSRMLIISPMTDGNAVSYAKDMGMEVCSYAEDAALS